MLCLFFRIWIAEGIAQCFITNGESAQECYTRLAAVATGIERLKLRGELEWFPDIIESRTRFVAGVRRSGGYRERTTG